jgi:enamine deaminase RidA (YjgF/YER057c/UK114 family)
MPENRSVSRVLIVIAPKIQESVELVGDFDIRIRLDFSVAYLYGIIKQLLKMSRQNILTGSPWEEKMGYCRAVRIGNIIEVSGTVAIVDGEKVKADDAYAQTLNILERIEKVLEEAGAGMKDVVRTRIFTTDIAQFDNIAKAHGAYFKDIKPTTGIYEISKLVTPEYMVEIEFTAVL